MLYWHSSSLTTHILILNVNWKLVLRLHLLNVNQRQFEISCLKKSSYLLDVLQAKFSAVCTVSCYACQVLPQQFYFTVLTYSRCDYVWDFFFFFLVCSNYWHFSDEIWLQTPWRRPWERGCLLNRLKSKSCLEALYVGCKTPSGPWLFLSKQVGENGVELSEILGLCL